MKVIQMLKTACKRTNETSRADNASLLSFHSQPTKIDPLELAELACRQSRISEKQRKHRETEEDELSVKKMFNYHNSFNKESRKDKTKNMKCLCAYFNSNLI